MKAVVVHTYDGPEALQIRDVPEPPPRDDAVLIDVRAVGVNFPDLLQTRGLYQWKPDLPFILGVEVAGLVRHAPAGSSVAVGDRVAALCLKAGGMAEVVSVPAECVLPLPPSVSFEAGAGLVVNDLTVLFALTQRGRLVPGATVLVHGAAGGIGTSALRLSRAIGATRIIAVVSSPDKADVAAGAGATDVVLSRDWLAQVQKITAGSGVDLVVDPVGGDRFTDSLRSLAPGGTLLVIGFADGSIPTVKVNRLLLKNIAVLGVAWGAWVATHPGFLQRQWSEYLRLFDSGRLELPEPAAEHFADVVDALLALESRSVRGKVVLSLT